MAALLLIGFALGLAIGVPVALAMGAAGLVTVLAGGGLSPLLVPQQLFRGVNSFPLMAVPFFILAAELMTAGGLTRALLRFSNDLVGHIRGGLGHVNVLISMLFAGISGSALADAAGPSAVVMRLMRKTGYDPDYAGALSAATATIGPIIPPSILMVVYAITDSRVTVAGLFVAGVVPGLLLGAVLAAANHWIAGRRGYVFRDRRASLGELGKSLWAALPALLMPVIILGGILGGVFTATEAGAAAVAYALVVGGFITRELAWRDLPRVFTRAGVITSAVLLIVAMATLFAWLLTFLQIPQSLAGALAALTDDRLAILVLLSVFVLLCGLVIDTLPALIILVPVLSPIAARVGIDPLHFAVILVLNLTIGMITPPVGPVLFVVSAVGRIDLERLARAVLPLLLAELLVLAAVILLPPLSTALPALFGYTH
ncbi:TRAP transporter large permease [Haliangium sp.]|uniref:TRAP transporter large permease n=1 Tax=Haliangium sp. TaxID=2663208 RepID=UPI003D1095D9